MGRAVDDSPEERMESGSKTSSEDNVESSGEREIETLKKQSSSLEPAQEDEEVQFEFTTIPTNVSQDTVMISDNTPSLLPPLLLHGVSADSTNGHDNQESSKSQGGFEEGQGALNGEGSLQREESADQSQSQKSDISPEMKHHQISTPQSMSMTSHSEMPEKAFQDSRYLEFIKTLDHKPEGQDYFTSAIQVLGDSVDERYRDKLNQAMDQVFYDVVKEELSWNTFEKVSTWLFLQGLKAQDRLMLVPCFARQLMEFVPKTMGSVITKYTKGFLDTHASEENWTLDFEEWVSFTMDMMLCHSHAS